MTRRAILVVFCIVQYCLKESVEGLPEISQPSTPQSLQRTAPREIQRLMATPSEEESISGLSRFLRLVGLQRNLISDKPQRKRRSSGSGAVPIITVYVDMFDKMSSEIQKLFLEMLGINNISEFFSGQSGRMYDVNGTLTTSIENPTRESNSNRNDAESSSISASVSVAEVGGGTALSGNIYDVTSVSSTTEDSVTDRANFDNGHVHQSVTVGLALATASNIGEDDRKPAAEETYSLGETDSNGPNSDLVQTVSYGTTYYSSSSDQTERKVASADINLSVTSEITWKIDGVSAPVDSMFTGVTAPVGHFGKDSFLRLSLCPCKCRQKPSYQLITPQEAVKKLKAELSVNRNELSSVRRKNRSSPDARESSKTVAGLAAVLLFFTASLFLIPDVISLASFLQCMLRCR